MKITHILVRHILKYVVNRNLPCRFCKQKAIAFYHRNRVIVEVRQVVDQIRFHTRIVHVPK